MARLTTEKMKGVMRRRTEDLHERGMGGPIDQSHVQTSLFDHRPSQLRIKQQLTFHSIQNGNGDNDGEEDDLFVTARSGTEESLRPHKARRQNDYGRDVQNTPDSATPMGTSTAAPVTPQSPDHLVGKTKGKQKQYPPVLSDPVSLVPKFSGLTCHS